MEEWGRREDVKSIFHQYKGANGGRVNIQGEKPAYLQKDLSGEEKGAYTITRAEKCTTRRVQKKEKERREIND